MKIVVMAVNVFQLLHQPKIKIFFYKTDIDIDSN